MFSSISARRIFRVAVAGAIAAIPLTALAMPASATPSAPGVTPAYNQCAFGPFQDWSCNNNVLVDKPHYGAPPYGRGPGWGEGWGGGGWGGGGWNQGWGGGGWNQGWGGGWNQGWGGGWGQGFPGTGSFGSS
ncbi:hypothetical protein [Nocardia araoensis]|uniref:hypothetical protein n=1 Tax=Nocardia araoensis TaxID=228600 RepID=UPI0012F623F0|nr:hypothetical protein [Nocardia araoensis]